MTKPLLILDLDETLVHAREGELERPADFRCFQYSVYIRPCVSEFLAKVSPCYQLSVWTSSSPDYAQIIVDHLFDGYTLEFLWARNRCTNRYNAEWARFYWVKDLKKVRRKGYALEQVLMVDDTAKKLERNYGNYVKVSSWEGDLEDRELLQLAEYLNRIHSTDNFRRLDKRQWKKQ